VAGPRDVEEIAGAIHAFVTQEQRMSATGYLRPGVAQVAPGEYPSGLRARAIVAVGFGADALAELMLPVPSAEDEARALAIRRRDHVLRFGAILWGALHRTIQQNLAAAPQDDPEGASSVFKAALDRAVKAGMECEEPAGIAVTTALRRLAKALEAETGEAGARGPRGAETPLILALGAAAAAYGELAEIAPAPPGPS
jgi:hypothetical protein